MYPQFILLFSALFLEPKICKVIIKFFKRHLYDFQHITGDYKFLINSIFKLFMSFCIFIFWQGISRLWDLTLTPKTLVDLINTMLGLRYEKDMYKICTTWVFFGRLKISLKVQSGSQVNSKGSWITGISSNSATHHAWSLHFSCKTSYCDFFQSEWYIVSSNLILTLTLLSVF